MRIFIDTSALIAFIDADDEFHDEAVKIYSYLLRERILTFTSNYILLETIVILKNRIGLEAVRLFNNDIMPILKIHWIDETLHNLCVNNLIIANRKKVSLVDYTSFEIMRKLNISKVFTFDYHFREIGFEII
jgi:predicted nucleic acid-binding protein